MDTGAFPGMAGNAHIIGRAINQLDSLLYIVKSDTVGGIRTVGALQLFPALPVLRPSYPSVIRNINVETVVLPGIQSQPDLPVAFRFLKPMQNRIFYNWLEKQGKNFVGGKGKNCPVSCRYN